MSYLQSLKRTVNQLSPGIHCKLAWIVLHDLDWLFHIYDIQTFLCRPFLSLRKIPQAINRNGYSSISTNENVNQCISVFVYIVRAIMARSFTCLDFNPPQKKRRSEGEYLETPVFCSVHWVNIKQGNGFSQKQKPQSSPRISQDGINQKNKRQMYGSQAWNTFVSYFRGFRMSTIPRVYSSKTWLYYQFRHALSRDGDHFYGWWNSIYAN